MKKIAWMSRRLNDKVIECLACNHRCKLSEGKTGICGVRMVSGGELRLLVYGRAIAQHVDPMEKKPLYHFYPGSAIFSIGTVGCDFRCSFCQNWDIAQYPKTHDDVVEVGEELMPSDIVSFCERERIPAIAYTYNEPAIFFEYAYDTARKAHEKGIRNVYVSNGFETREALEKILPYLDAINIDLKSFRNEFYVNLCGGRVEPVKENIAYLWSKGVWVEVTTLIIPRENDSDEELRNIAKFLCSISPDIPWHISRFHPCYKMLDRESTPRETLERAYEIGQEAGLRYVYVGNISDPVRESTYCPRCGACVIARTGYSVKIFLDGDKCQKCGEEIAGRFGMTCKI